MKRSSVIFTTATAVAAIAAGTAFGMSLPDGDTSEDQQGPEHPLHRPTANADSALDTIDDTAATRNATFFAGSLGGDQEVPVPGGPAVGDPNGHALAVMRVQGDRVSFAFSFHGIGTPTMGHLHQGVRGRNGEVRIPFFTRKLPDGRTFATGTVKVTDMRLLEAVGATPGDFYVNLHTEKFPGGAVRGQLHKLDRPLDMNQALNSLAAPVVRGSQIYTCARQDDGTFAFTQNDVRATLGQDIVHSSTRPGGAPQWVAPDRSAVTGKLLGRLPNGDTNIPELDLAADSSGEPRGLLASTGEVLRLNTHGGVAPAGACDPHRQPRIAVPYRADYLFIAK